MLTFHGDPKIKEFYVNRVSAHYDADEIVKGKYWENGKGCAVGCTIHGNNHFAYETELGIPIMIARLQDRIFEGLPNKLSKEFPLNFITAVPVGVDLSRVGWKFLHWLISTQIPQNKITIQVCQVLENPMNGLAIDENQADDAFAIADAAADDAAIAADDAADAADDAVYAAAAIADAAADAADAVAARAADARAADARAAAVAARAADARAADARAAAVAARAADARAADARAAAVAARAAAVAAVYAADAAAYAAVYAARTAADAAADAAAAAAAAAAGNAYKKMSEKLIELIKDVNIKEDK
jgi:hypothetical protein